MPHPKLCVQSTERYEIPPALLAARWGTLCQRMLDVLNTPGHNKQSHKYKPHFGMVSAKESRAAWTVCGSNFYWETVQRNTVFPVLGRIWGGSQVPHASAWAAEPCSSSWSSPALGHLPSLLVTLRVLPGIPLAEQLSCLISLSLCKQGRGGWKHGKHPCIPEKQRGFGSSSTAGCLHQQIPHLVITFCV